jgi:hypothetical protein
MCKPEWASALHKALRAWGKRGLLGVRFVGVTPDPHPPVVIKKSHFKIIHATTSKGVDPADFL